METRARWLLAITVPYPDRKLQVTERFRGAPALVLNPDTGAAKCVGCGICVRTCPHGVIHLTTRKGASDDRIVESYQIDLVRCLFCGLCEEACPFGAIKMSHKYELAAYERYGLHYDRKYWIEPPKEALIKQ